MPGAGTAGGLKNGNAFDPDRSSIGLTIRALT